MSKIIDLTGMVFGRLTVLKFNRIENHRTFWDCLCTCGNTISTSSSRLKTGCTKSCGCLKLELFNARAVNKNDPHRERAYHVWRAMLSRCLKEENKDFKHYGGKGIKVCDRWLKFENFYADMGEPPPKLQLERKDSNGDYCPENCIWATKKTQLDNRCCTIWVIMPDGRQVTASDAFRELGCSKSMFFRKIKRPEGFLGCVLAGDTYGTGK